MRYKQAVVGLCWFSVDLGGLGRFTVRAAGGALRRQTRPPCNRAVE
jgi:hypothetical protein